MQLMFPGCLHPCCASWERFPCPSTDACTELVQVGETEKKNYEAGAHTMRFHSDDIALGDVKKSWLNNVGLLTASLTSREEDIAQICAVTQVTKGADGELQRRMMSPLE